MKNLFFVLFVLALLAGCINVLMIEMTNYEHPNHAAAESMKKTETMEAPKYQQLIPSPNVPDDLKLIRSGQSITSQKGKLTLKSILPVNKVYLLNGIEFIINDVKIMHFKPNTSLNEFFHLYTDKNEFDFIKINVELVNSKSEKVNFSPIASLNFNSQHLIAEDDFYQENLNGDIAGGETKTGSLGFILQNPPAKINKIDITTSDVVGPKMRVMYTAKQIHLEAKNK